MNRSRIPSLALALVLQVVPVCRVVTTSSAIVTPTFAIIARCAAAIAALLGSMDAVSGASVSVYVAGVQSVLPGLPGVKTNITGRVGSPMVLRIVLAGSVGQQPQLDYYNATPLPPGLTINTNVNTNSLGLASTNYYIYGTPTLAGVYYPVRVSAGNLLYPTVSFTNILITITNASGGSPPAITSQPSSRTVTNGGVAVFSVTATGALTYQWRKNGTNLPVAASSTYTIPSVTTNDAGAFTVVASNASGSITSVVATLNVLVPPEISGQPQSITVTNGAPARFEVVAFGLPSPTYQWKFNGSPIAGASNAATCLIDVTQAGDEGDYTVEVSNIAGTLLSSVAHLTVQSPVFPPELSGLRIESGVASFDVRGPANVDFVILSSPDLMNWVPVQTNATASGMWRFVDQGAAAQAAKFYRAVVQ